MPLTPGYPTARTARIADALRGWLHAERLSQAAAGERVGLSQPTVSRALQGLLPESSPALNSLCAAAGIVIDHVAALDERLEEVPLPPPLTRALRRLWNGSEGDVERITRLLDSAAALRTSAGAAGFPPAPGASRERQDAGEPTSEPSTVVPP